MDADDVAEAPIHSINSGPAMAPVAGRHYAAATPARHRRDRRRHRRHELRRQPGARRAASRGRARPGSGQPLPRPHDRLPLGRRARASAPAAARSPGSTPAACCTSARRAPAPTPGPACYGTRRHRRRRSPTPRWCSATSIPAFFLGGAMPLDLEAARAPRSPAQVGEPLGLDDVEEAAAAVAARSRPRRWSARSRRSPSTRASTRARPVLVGGGGAAGLNAVAVARRLGCAEVVIPAVGAALSAAGALMSDLSAELCASIVPTTSERFDAEAVNAVLAELERARARRSSTGPAAGSVEQTHRAIRRGPLPAPDLGDRGAAARRPLRGRDATCAGLRRRTSTPRTADLRDRDPGSPDRVRRPGGARVRCRLRDAARAGSPPASTDDAGPAGARQVYFAERRLGRGAGPAASRRCAATRLGRRARRSSSRRSRRSWSTRARSPAATAARQPRDRGGEGAA